MRVVTLCIAVSAAAAHNVIELHGSGTTNPSRWFWEIFDIMEARAKEPLHMTYRAIGSSTGMQEFVGPNSNFTAQADFGAGDIPMSSTRFTQLVANNREMLHVPVAIGAIALFHSVPESELGGQPLSLDACLIARIYAGDITTWNHPDILAENPTLTATAPIKVAHRVEGSSSTSGFTTYLSEKCPSDWTLGGASTFCANGCANDWPVGVGREGSGGMSDYLEAEPYAIAYIDSGHGIASGLAEIALQNFDGVFLKSSAADVGAAATRGIASGVFPTDPSASFANVELFDLPGPTTWPITMVTYIYLEKDWSTKDRETAGLLEAFMRFVISPEGQALAVENLFVPMPQALIDLANSALDAVIFPDDMVRFVRETSTLGEAGTQDYVISDKRQSYADYERKELIQALAETRATQATLMSTISAIGSQSAFEVHGSGTTNPSRWFWEVFDILEARAKERLHMTYRAVGSSVGMLEFVGPAYGYTAQADFGAGDIPMSASRFAELSANNRKMLHVPVAIGAIALFHSIPESELGGDPIDLDSCLIARIYAGDITRWDHPDIKAINPKMTAISPIYVAHRVDGSSSTSGFTTYLSQNCETQWTLGGASSFTNWPVGVGREGSGGMSDYLVSRPYAIAYIDSGHGIDNGLSEIALRNFDGVYLKSSGADIGAAATRGVSTGVFPTEPDATFANVELFDLPGPTTWPITMVTYIYLEQDWTAKSPQTAALLYAFVQFIISPEGQALAKENLFVEMPAALITLANKALSMVTLPEGTIPFTRESSTLSQAGQQAYVISDKRTSFADYERKELLKELAQTKASQALLLDALAQENDLFQQTLADLEDEHEAYERAVQYVDEQSSNAAMAIGGLIMGILALILSLIALLVALWKRNTTSTPTFSSRPGVELKNNAV